MKERVQAYCKGLVDMKHPHSYAQAGGFMLVSLGVIYALGVAATAVATQLLEAETFLWAYRSRLTGEQA
jgi:hypothetical protein